MDPSSSSRASSSSLLAFPLKRRAFALIVFGALLVAGVVTLQTIPKTEDPVFPIPTFPVTVILPGASPSDVERLVVDPLEREIKKIEGLKTLKATAQEGVGVVVPNSSPASTPTPKPTKSAAPSSTLSCPLMCCAPASSACRATT